MASKLTEYGRKWVSTELKGNDASHFRAYLFDNGVSFETSDAGYGYTHFECLMSDDEMEKANAFIDTL